jgi:hypothetical protein
MLEFRDWAVLSLSGPLLAKLSLDRLASARPQLTTSDAPLLTTVASSHASASRIVLYKNISGWKLKNISIAVP